ncbi:hypothetical protein ACFS5N_16355 [Mucilaginibacter ximonensis]|uniref:Uncharacterized protein n=1 Tax=Mucilaginibacter ximonensis TaxID=538021 RepID=A0ABW5YFM2_9SPHI
MIRFIDLRGQIYLDDDPCFAWFTTICDRFHTFNDNQHWNSLESFISDYKAQAAVQDIADPLERYLRLIPEGYFLEMKESESDGVYTVKMTDTYYKHLLKNEDSDTTNEKSAGSINNPASDYYPNHGRFNCNGDYIWPTGEVTRKEEPVLDQSGIVAYIRQSLEGNYDKIDFFENDNAISIRVWKNKNYVDYLFDCNKLENSIPSLLDSTFNTIKEKLDELGSYEQND